MNQPIALPSHHSPVDTSPVSANVRSVPLQILIEMVLGFRQPAVVLDARGQVLHANAAAQRSIEASQTRTDGAAANSQEWPYRVAFSANDQVHYLAMASRPSTESVDVAQLPPRLAKIARLVVSGFTDKQIASRTGLSFSTIRTYVRQIYRRAGVHSRVELVHASNAGVLGP